MFSSNEVFGIFAQLCGALLWHFEGVQNRECLLELLGNLLLHTLGHTQLLVQRLDSRNLLGIGQIVAEVCRAQHLSLLLVGTREGLNHQDGLLAFEDVATNLLAESLIAKAIEQIVLKLECQTHLQRKVVEVASIFVGGTCKDGSDDCRARQKGCGFELDHSHIIDHRHLLLGLEIHIELLSLAHLGCHLVEPLENL